MTGDRDTIESLASVGDGEMELAPDVILKDAFGDRDTKTVSLQTNQYACKS